LEDEFFFGAAVPSRSRALSDRAKNFHPHFFMCDIYVFATRVALLRLWVYAVQTRHHAPSNRPRKGTRKRFQSGTLPLVSRF
jgi:hypothetical protein